MPHNRAEIEFHLSSASGPLGFPLEYATPFIEVWDRHALGKFIHPEQNKEGKNKLKAFWGVGGGGAKWLLCVLKELPFHAAITSKLDVIRTTPLYLLMSTALHRYSLPLSTHPAEAV